MRSAGYAAITAATSTGTASLKLDSDPLGSQFLNDSADAAADRVRAPGRRRLRAHQRFARAEPPCHPASVSSSADFEAAQARVKTLTSTPSPDELLELYALFKQSTKGDVTGSRPGMLDFKGRAKFDAWEKKKGLARDAAQKAYVELVSKLEARYGKA